MRAKAPRSGMLQKIACIFGRHHRNSRHARKRKEIWYSVCSGCGAEMVKPDDESGWMLTETYFKRRRAAFAKSDNA